MSITKIYIAAQAVSLPASDDSSGWYPPVLATAANRPRSKSSAPLSYCYPSPLTRYHRASWSSSCTVGRTRVSRSRRASGRAAAVPRSSCTWEAKVSQETCTPADRSSWRTPWLTWTERCNLGTEVRSERKNIVQFSGSILDIQRKHWRKKYIYSSDIDVLWLVYLVLQ